MKKTTKIWKICSRGHKYRGSGPCSICWPALRRRLRQGQPGQKKKSSFVKKKANKK